jgi:hypothetical protein
MNDIFEPRRFGLLLKKTIFERPIQLIGPIVLTLCATLAIYSLMLYFVGWNPAQNSSFILGYVGGGVFLASVVFGYFSTNANGSAYLTLPASYLEKWLCGVMIAGVLFSCIFFLFYRVMDASFVSVYHNGLDKNNPQYKIIYDYVHVYTFDSNMVWQSTSLYLNFVGAILVGSLYFNRVSTIKVALIYGAIIGMVYFLNLLLAHILFNNVDDAIPFNNVFIKAGTGAGTIELPHLAYQAVGISWFYIIPGILWITAGVRLKEKEI